MQRPEREPGMHDLFGERLPADRIRADTGRHFAVTTLAGVGTKLLRLATLMILARLLAPADFGVVAMVMSVYGVAELLMDLGLSAATVQRSEVTASQVNTLFWINAGLAAALTIAGVALAPLLAAWFSDPRLETAGSILSLGFLLGGLAAQPMALLRRHLRFGTIARISIGSALANCATALALAWLGWGFWALVWASLAGHAATVLGAWLRSGWRPAAPSYDRSSRDMLAFGGYLAAFALLTYLGRNLHLVFIGRLWGAAATGLYSRASGLLEQPLNFLTGPLRLIAPAALARLTSSPADFRRYYVEATALLMLAVAPLSVWLAIFAPDIVAVVLGAQWTAAGDLLRWLGIGLVPQVLNQSTGWLYIATGRSRAMMQWGMGGWLVVIACLLLGLRWGVEGVAGMHTLSMFLIAVPCLHYACRGTEISLRDIARAAWQPSVGAAAAAVVLIPLEPAMRDWHALYRILLGGAVYGVAFLALSTTVLGQRRRLQGLGLHVSRLLRERTLPLTASAASPPRDGG